MNFFNWAEKEIRNYTLIGLFFFIIQLALIIAFLGFYVITAMAAVGGAPFPFLAITAVVALILHFLYSTRRDL
jgi:hypothetical protein